MVLFAYENKFSAQICSETCISTPALAIKVYVDGLLWLELIRCATRSRKNTLCSLHHALIAGKISLSLEYNWSF